MCHNISQRRDARQARSIFEVFGESRLAPLMHTAFIAWFTKRLRPEKYEMTNRAHSPLQCTQRHDSRTGRKPIKTKGRSRPIRTCKVVRVGSACTRSSPLRGTNFAGNLAGSKLSVPVIEPEAEPGAAEVAGWENVVARPSERTSRGQRVCWPTGQLFFASEPEPDPADTWPADTRIA